jgi:zinc protease
VQNARHLLLWTALTVLALGCASSIPVMQTTSKYSESTESTGAVPASAPRRPAAGVFPYAVERHVLPNGLKLLFIPTPSDGLVSYWSIVRTGSRDEVEQGVTGFAHFFEHMMFHGSEQMPKPVYEGLVKGMGADSNAYTTDDYTAYHMSFAKEDLATVVKIEADRFQHLAYGEPQFKTEAGAVYGEYRKSRTSPFSVLFEAVQDAAFDVHTYKHTTIGFERDIQDMPNQFAYSRTFFERFYRPENVVIVVTGDFEPAKTKKLVEQHYAGWKKGYVAPKVTPEPPQTAQRRITVPFDGQTLPILALNFKGERLLPGDRTFMAATLIGELAFGQTSDVYRKLVIDERRVRSLYEDFGLTRDPGLWSVFTEVKQAADVPAVEGELFGAIERLQREPVDAARLDEARSRARYAFLSALSSPNGVAEVLARIVALTGDVSAVDEMFTTLEAVTPADVQKAAQRWLVPERCTVALVHSKDAPPVTAQAGAEPPVLLPVEQDQNVAFNLWIRAGSQDDPAGKEGLAALTAGLVSDGGTQRRTYEEILAELFPLAGGYSASVDKEMTVFSGQVHKDKLAPFYELFADALLQPAFAPEDFERIRSNMVAGIEKSLRYASDEELGKAALNAAVFAGTPYEHLVEGSVESLQSITLDDVRAFHAKYWTRDNLVIGLGGAYPADLPARLSADLARLPAGTPEAMLAPIPAPIPAPTRGRQVTLVEKPGPSAAISFGYPIDVRRGTPEFYALWVANSWLGEHRNSASHLYQVLREARGMNYGDYSYIEAFPQGGSRTMPPTGVGRRQQMFEVWIRPVPRARAVFALRAALREVELLAKNGMSETDFEQTKRFLSKYCLHFAETTAERLGYAVDDRFYGLEQSHLAEFRRQMAEVTLEQVNAAVRQHLQAANLHIAIVASDAEALKQALVSDAPSPIDYGGIEKPAEVLEQDRAIERYPLKIGADAVRIVPVDEMFQRPSRIDG